MKLTLDRDDLKPEYQDTRCSLTRFHHFLPAVQDAVMAVGRATFREYDESNYNAIYAPSQEAAS